MVTATGEVTRPAYGGEQARLNLHATVSLGKTQGQEASSGSTVLPLPKAERQGRLRLRLLHRRGTLRRRADLLRRQPGQRPAALDELNGGQPVLTSTARHQGVRDPFIIRSPEGDKFYMIATDQQIYGNGNWDAAQRQGSKSIVVWESTDLVNWTDQRPSRSRRTPPATPGHRRPTTTRARRVRRVLGVEALRRNDPNHTGNTYNRMMYATTSDFRTFSDAAGVDRPGLLGDRLDHHQAQRHLLPVHQGRAATVSGCLDIVQESSSTCVDVDLPATNPRNWYARRRLHRQERGTRRRGGAHCLQVEHRGEVVPVHRRVRRPRLHPVRKHQPGNADWKLSDQLRAARAPRHGTVLPVTRTELERLHSQLG